MGKQLIQDILNRQINTLAIIGMAKNTGKTVTLNTVIDEAVQFGLHLAIVSYGRDGEEVDAITNKRKPRVYIPSGTFFVTTTKSVEKSDLNPFLVEKLSHRTLMGDVGIFKTSDQGGYCELTGVNSQSHIYNIKEKLSADVDLLLIDGALDRRSSAIPDITEGVIMTTGAAIANSEDEVVKKTISEIETLSLTCPTDDTFVECARYFFHQRKTGFLLVNGQYLALSNDQDAVWKDTDLICEFIHDNFNYIRAIFIPGALTNNLIEVLIYSANFSNGTIVVEDGTKIFLNERNLNLLRKLNVDLYVFSPIELIAITVNPINADGVILDSNLLIQELSNQLTIPVYDLYNGY